MAILLLWVTGVHLVLHSCDPDSNDSAKACFRLMSHSRSRLCMDSDNNAKPGAGSASQRATESPSQPLPPPAQASAQHRAMIDRPQELSDQQSLISQLSG